MMSKVYRYKPAFLLLGLLTLASCSQTSLPATEQAEIQSQATGMYVQDGKIKDVNGVNFVFQGVNYPYAWTSRTFEQVKTDLGEIRKKGANSVRIVLSTSCKNPSWKKATAAQVEELILASTQMVVILEVHDTTGYVPASKYPTLAFDSNDSHAFACSINNAVDYWKTLAATLNKYQNRVILNIGNEPYGNYKLTNGTFRTDLLRADWIADHKKAIADLRAAGIQNVLMVDAPNWGQDWTNTMRDNALEVFNSDSQKNVVFSVHMYEVYNTATKVNDYINSFKTTNPTLRPNLPLVVGEFASSHTGGSYVDAATIMSSSKPNANGYLGWSWSGNDSSTAALDMVYGFNAGSATPWGTMIFNDLASAKVASNFTTTTPPTTGETVLFSFEGSTQSWTGTNVAAGPWLVNEWATNGSNSLKADVVFGNRKYELKNTATRSFSGKTTLRARVKHASWGTAGSGVTAKIFVKTGAGWTYYSGGSQTINGSTATTLSMGLSGVANLGDVKEIGVEFTSPTNSSGNSAIYVDQVSIQ